MIKAALFFTTLFFIFEVQSYIIPLRDAGAFPGDTVDLSVEDFSRVLQKEISKLTKLIPDSHKSKERFSYYFTFNKGSVDDIVAFKIGTPVVSFPNGVNRKVVLEVTVNPKVLKNFNTNNPAFVELVWMNLLPTYISPAKWDFWIANSSYGDSISDEMLRGEVVSIMKKIFDGSNEKKLNKPISPSFYLENARHLYNENLFGSRASGSENYDLRQGKAQHYFEYKIKEIERREKQPFEALLRDSVRNEDRALVAGVFNQIIPWSFLPPVEHQYWKSFVSSIVRPTTENITIYRGETGKKTIQPDQYKPDSHFGVARIFNDRSRPDLPPTFNVDLGSLIDSHVINKYLENQKPKSVVISAAVDPKTVKQFMADPASNNISTITIPSGRFVSSFAYSYYTAGEVLVPFIVFPSEVRNEAARTFAYEQSHASKSTLAVNEASRFIFRTPVLSCDKIFL